MGHVEAGIEYARRVVDGRIPACKWTKLACQRQLDDLARWSGRNGEYWFDAESAEYVCNFAECFKHIKGRGFAGKEIRLEPFQQFTYSSVFGWKREDGTRRFRTAYNEWPRKNAKSTSTAPVGLYLLAADEEPGSEVYSAATTRDQAKIVFEVAQRMADRDAEFRGRFGVEVRAHAITVEDTASIFKALSAEGDTLDGLNVHGGLIDELHAHPTRKVFDVIETGMGARTQALLWLITTAGVNLAGICYEQRSYLMKILEGVAKDESYWGMIYSIDEGDDPFDEQSWRKANPNYGVSVFPAYLQDKARKAQQLPSALNNFLTKHLDVWCQADNPWMDMQAWHRAADRSLKIEDFASDPCWITLDLASKRDLAALSFTFRRGQHYYHFGRYYLNEEAIEESSNAMYSGWEREGRLQVTDGNVTDFEQIEADVIDHIKRYRVVRVGADPNQFNYFGQRLAKQFPNKIVEIPQHVNQISPAMKEMEALVHQGRYHHDGNPVMTWNISNVVASPKPGEQIFPTKQTPENKIDAAVAAIMGVKLAMSEPDAPKPWVLMH